jgi:hypothetical protein
LKEQRQNDKEPPDPQPYYHWIQGGVDFIYLDNAANHFSRPQLNWLHKILAADKPETNLDVKSIVVGRHEALPHSLGNAHSMGDDKAGEEGRATGKEAYDALENFRDESRNRDGSHKAAYVLASHSHFCMENIFDTDKLNRPQQENSPAGLDRGDRRSRALCVSLRSTADCENRRLRRSSGHGLGRWDDSIRFQGSARIGCSAVGSATASRFPGSLVLRPQLTK